MINTKFTPTWLYIKIHNKTKMLYFGKTTRNVENYTGSGIYWVRHITKYGKEYVSTLWCRKFYNANLLEKFAIKFSEEMDIVKSQYWANLKKENGLDGGSFGLSDGAKQKISAKATGRKHSVESKLKMSLSRSGEKSCVQDKTCYRLVNRYTNEMFEGTQMQFRKQYLVPKNMFTNILKGRTYSSKCGWRLCSVDPIITELDVSVKRWYNNGSEIYLLYPDDPKTYGLIFGKLENGCNNPNAMTVKIISPENNEMIITGGLSDFCQLYNLKLHQIRAVLDGNKSDADGWRATRL